MGDIQKVTNISFFIKVGVANVLLKLNYLQIRVETQYRKVIFITPSHIKHFIERSSVTFRWVKNRYHEDFQYLMVSIHFFFFFFFFILIKLKR